MVRSAAKLRVSNHGTDTVLAPILRDARDADAISAFTRVCDALWAGSSG